MKCFLPPDLMLVWLRRFPFQRLVRFCSNWSCTKCLWNHLLSHHSLLVQHSPVQGRREDSDESMRPWLGFHPSSHTLSHSSPYAWERVSSLLKLVLWVAVKQKICDHKRAGAKRMSVDVLCPGSSLSWFWWFILAGRVLMAVRVQKSPCWHSLFSVANSCFL